MESNILSIVIGALVAIITSGLTGWFAYRTTVKRVESEKETAIPDAIDKIAEANKKTMENLMGELNRVNTELDSLRAELAIWKSGTRKLIRQLEDLEIEPDWRPPR